MKDQLTVSTELPASPAQVFNAWLSSKGHAAFTGAPAKIEARVGGAFSAWDGYITGQTLALEPYHRILQSWRTTDFADDDADSSLEVLIDEVEGGSRLTLVHTNLPEGSSEEYRQGWEDYYFAPMKDYFAA